VRQKASAASLRLLDNTCYDFREEKSAPHLTAMDGGNAENAGAIFGRLRHLLPARGEKEKRGQLPVACVHANQVNA